MPAGNDWDQALLLRDLLGARGYDARLEWGRVTLPVAKAMNLVGTEDPLYARWRASKASPPRKR